MNQAGLREQGKAIVSEARDQVIADKSSSLHVGRRLGHFLLRLSLGVDMFMHYVVREFGAAIGLDGRISPNDLSAFCFHTTGPGRVQLLLARFVFGKSPRELIASSDVSWSQRENREYHRSFRTGSG
jgi:hypothetical protein